MRDGELIISNEYRRSEVEIRHKVDSDRVVERRRYMVMFLNMLNVLGRVVGVGSLKVSVLSLEVEMFLELGNMRMGLVGLE